MQNTNTRIITISGMHFDFDSRLHREFNATIHDQKAIGFVKIGVKYEYAPDEDFPRRTQIGYRPIEDKDKKETIMFPITSIGMYRIEDI